MNQNEPELEDTGPRLHQEQKLPGAWCLQVEGQEGRDGAEGHPEGTHVYLVVPKALLNLVQQAAIVELTQSRQVIVGSRRHQLDLRNRRVWSILTAFQSAVAMVGGSVCDRTSKV